MSDSYVYDRVEEGHGFKWIVTKAGKKITFYDAERSAKRGLTTLWRGLSRMGKLAKAREDDYDWDWEQIDFLLDETERMLHLWREQVRKHNVRRSAEERIAQLRRIEGRTPEEAAAYQAKANELERRLAS